MFRNLRWRLLISYLSVMVAIVSTSTTVMYQFVRHSLYDKLDRQLIILADAASHSLAVIQSDTGAVDRSGAPTFDDDGDLDIPWQDLREDEQGVQWFDVTGQRLGEAGKYLPNMPLVADFRVWQANRIRSITVPVYGSTQQLQGYVRVSASTVELEEDLDRLLWGFGWGGLVAVVLSGVSGWWLTQQSFRPIEQSFLKLKQFTADASHELRSPLTAIRTSVEVMQSHPERIHPADVKKLSAIASATQQMTQLVEDLLLLARTDATIAPRNWVTIPLDELLEDLVELLLPQAEIKGVHLKWVSSGEVSVWGDALQVRRLFLNLLENALQYTPAKGTVAVSLAVSERFAVVRVEDTGIGIAPDHLPLVFDRFWRADQARQRRVGGAGLGLAIAQAIAQNHGGEITATSRLGVGSCFSVFLPIALPKATSSFH